MSSFKLLNRDGLGDDKKGYLIERLGDFHRENEERRQRNERPISANKLTAELMENGISYKRQDMLDDIRRSGVTFRAKDIPAQDRASRFYDNIIEPIRQKYGVNQKEAFKIWNRIKEQDYKNLIEASDYADFWDIYSGG